MAVSVAEASVDSVTVSAPLEPNINHRATVFGEAPRQWAFWLPGHCCTCACVMPGLTAQLVIQRNSMEYDRPINGAFTARAELAAPERWELFRKTLERRGRSRISVNSVLEFDGEVAGRLSGDFVALVV